VGTLTKAVAVICTGLFLLIFTGAVGTFLVLYQFGRGLPDYQQLAHYEPPTVTRVHAGDGSLLAEYAREKRVFMPVAAIPKQVIHAFLASEDKTFYQHAGVDLPGIIRAMVTNAVNYATARRPVGASTITQQVAKNFLLTNEVSIERKIKEAILAFRIERAFTKDQILELYLNEIYLGFGSYGVAAAALNYFDKPLDELTLAETAFLAALPKAPNNYHPVRNRQAALDRRNWVLGRMTAEGFISVTDAKFALTQPLTIRTRSETRFVNAEYFTEEVRRALISSYGETGLYEGGLSVRTTLDPRLQDIAERSLRKGIEDYDRRHGWRGPIDHFKSRSDWPEHLARIQRDSSHLGGRKLALILACDELGADIGFASGARGYLPMEEMTWARPWRHGQRVGKKPTIAKDILRVGDVITVVPSRDGSSGLYSLSQVPDVEGAIVVLDPHTGRILALVGGYSFEGSEFNRATQAMRQPGSAFKPFVYAAALENGFTPSSLVLDAPFVVDQGPDQAKWKPANYTKKFYGPSTLRLGIEKSRNLMTVRLAQYIGMDSVVDYARRFELVDDMPRLLSMALGAGETTLLRLTTAYAMFVNGGKKIVPTVLDRIQDRRGKTVYRHDKRLCPGCQNIRWHRPTEPQILDARPRIIEASTAYQVVSMLQGAVQRGTGRRIRGVGRPLAGKTGTTNDSFDTWFIGFSPDLAIGVYVGFDKPKSLGPYEQGASVAAPVFKQFVAEALAGEPIIPFRIPPGIRLVRVNAENGMPARLGEQNVILEAFRPGSEPESQGPVIDGSDSLVSNESTIRAGTGGLY
jgi:penicillin-binding protein 1A